jgi:hypothetical protein
MKKFLVIALIAGFTALSTTANAQMCDTIADFCGKTFTNSYISDGQSYRALLIDDQTAEFQTTFYGGTQYRVSACSGFEEGALIFKLFDSQGNLLFQSNDFGNTAYWDFKVESTLECKIEAQLDGTYSGSGCAVILIGFKE